MPRNALLIAFSLLVSSGCATMDQRAPEPVRAETPDTQTEPAEPDSTVVERAFEPDALYLLLTGEIAAQRGQYDVTLNNYVQAARLTRDIGVIQRAILVAETLKNQPALRLLTRTWIEEAPDSLEARRAAAIQSLRDGELDVTLGHLEHILQLGGDADFDSLAAMSPRLPADQQQELLKLFQQLQARQPDNQEIRYSTALLQNLSGAPEQALATLAPLMDQQTDFQPALVLQGELLFQLQRIDDALRHLQINTGLYPGNRQLGTLYARILVNQNELRAAQDEFGRLIERFPDDHGLRFSWALVAMENGELELAREQLQTLLKRNQQTEQATYYLGEIAEKQGRIDDAILLYDQVSEGSHFYPAVGRAAELRARHDDLDSALEHLRQVREAHPEGAANIWLIQVNLLQEEGLHRMALDSANQALSAHPDDQSLLYSRSLVLERLGLVDQAVADLEAMIALKADNPTALNALGYVLTVNTQRFSEAQAYIEEALELDPENPAILDSMGWVLFKQGNLPGALDYLRRAYSLYPDPEIATHYGEALWVTNQQAQARVVWKRALEEDPDYQPLLDTLKRLQVDDL